MCYVMSSGSDVVIRDVVWMEWFITDRTGIGFALFPFPPQIAVLRSQR